MLKTCAQCGDAFSTYKSGKKFCGPQCRRPPTRRCVVCGTAFEVRFRRDDRVTCTKACGGVLRRDARRGASHVAESLGHLALQDGSFARVDVGDFERCSAINWCLNGKGIVVGYVPGPRGERRMVRLNRFILEAQPGQIVDHADGDQRNNTRANLRFATTKQNAQNRRKPDVATTSRYKGVCWNGGASPWQAAVRLRDGTIQHLGVFADEESAARAYDAAARDLYGEFACVNFPNPGERAALVS